jgi:hypothetical protein
METRTAAIYYEQSGHRYTERTDIVVQVSSLNVLPSTEEGESAKVLKSLDIVYSWDPI